MTTMATELPDPPPPADHPDDLLPRPVRSRPHSRRASRRTVAPSRGGLRPGRGPWSPSGSREIGSSPPGAARGPRSTTPTSPPAPCQPRRWPLIQRRGCAVVRGHFPREQAQAWDAELVDYGTATTSSRTTGALGRLLLHRRLQARDLPDLLVRPQMEARQSDEMANVQSFLNSFWRNEPTVSNGSTPTVTRSHPDRVRRRPPGTNSGGLGHHLDPGTPRSVDDGRLPARLRSPLGRHRRGVLALGRRSPAPPVRSTRFHDASAFRTFQGWTALSDMDHDQGVLHAVPIPRRWPTSCSDRCSTTSPRMTCAA